MKFTFFLVFALLVIGGGTYWYLNSRDANGLTEEVIQEEHVGPVLPAEEPKDISQDRSDIADSEQDPAGEVLPDLEGSSVWIKESLKKVLTYPVFEDFFKQENVIRQFVAGVDRLGRGQNPFRQLSYLHPAGKFEVVEEGGSINLNKNNFRRVVPLMDGLSALPQDEVFAFYDRIKPWVLEAYAELGNPESWDEMVEKFYHQIESFTYPEAPVELVGREGIFIFKDPLMEAMSPLEKAMIRMGPEQSARFQKLARSYFTQWKERP